MNEKPNRESIVIVEDEPKIARLVADYLGNAGFETHIVGDGAAALDVIAEHSPALVVLDLMLPGKDGIEICRELRSRDDAIASTPVLMLTARVEEVDRLLGLEVGADDYVCKPFSPREVVARVQAILRRITGPGPADEDGLRLDRDRLLVKWQDREIEVTTVEFRLLQALREANGKILSRDRLIASAYEDGRVVSDRTMDSHIKKLRRKLRELDPETEFIHSVYGAGYRYEV
ncbi:MAG: response regulator [Gammaproteobacteria bacterium]|nr:response regulator [Gammaproteobacteria bacterium]